MLPKLKFDAQQVREALVKNYHKAEEEFRSCNLLDLPGISFEVPVIPQVIIDRETDKCIEIINYIINSLLFETGVQFIPIFDDGFIAYSPERQMAVEICSPLLQSELFVPRRYRIDKIDLYNKQDIQLFSFYNGINVETLKYLKNKLVGASRKYGQRHLKKMTIEKIDFKHSIFDCHIQGRPKTARHAYALCLDGEVLAAISLNISRVPFKHSSLEKKMHLDVNRVVYKSGVSVYGAAPTLMLYAMKDLGEDSLITLCDPLYTSGRLYKKIGMTHIKSRDNPPDFDYVNTERVLAQNSVKRGKYKRYNFWPPYRSEGPNIREHSVALAFGLYRYYTAGKRFYSVKMDEIN